MLHGALARARAFIRSRSPWHRHGDVESIRTYWSDPGPENDPALYLGELDDGAKRSRLLVRSVSACVPPSSKIFELGCNVGRNLAFLHRAGYCRLHGLEVNEHAIDLFHTHFPNAAAVSTVYRGAAEDLISGLPDRAFDLSFTMAVLEHIHSENEWIFEHLARITKTWLLTIEDEVTWSWRHFPRDYRAIFEALGFYETNQVRLNHRKHGLASNFRARVFKRG